MADTSRYNSIFGTADWKSIYSTYNQVDFQSYTFETLRKGFIDYLKTNYPESFNDYVDSSELIGLLNVVAFMGQGLAFRSDLNARENFIDTAERRDSVIKLANLVGYTPKRNTTASGFLKVSSIKTSQNITDLTGNNLSNITILWNDPANANWLDQMNTILNSAIVNSQRIGKPANSQDILGVITSEYSIQIPPTALPIVPFNAAIDGLSTKFELVSATSVDKPYVYEIAPALSGKFNFLFRNDQLGYGSPNTGYFFYFKQGGLQYSDFSFDQKIANQIQDINILGINNDDTWLYKLNTDGSRTQWTQVDNIYAESYVNVGATENSANSTKQLFSVRSRNNDQVSYVFGDDVFSEIPLGNFRAYVRAGNASTYTIQPSEMNGLSVTFTYVSNVGRNETLTIGLELTETVSNAQARETLADIKLRAPSRYYTQNRMVNGEDYNNFPFTMYNSILKSKAVSRSSAGASTNLDLLDPTLKYASNSIFSTDGGLYLDETNGTISLNISSTNDIISFFSNTLADILSLNRVNQYYVQNYPSYALSTPIYWNNSTVNSDSVTGYVYSTQDIINYPQSVGIYTTSTLKYLTSGSMLKFTAPNGYYFDTDNKLKLGVSSSGKNYIWATVLSVTGDGSNNGNGTFANGTGPITLNTKIPSGSILSIIIPAFSSSIPSDIIAECQLRLELNQQFTLVYDNSAQIGTTNWDISTFDDENYIVKFTNTANGVYSIQYRSLVYYFGSAGQNRFTYNNKLVYDPLSGKILQDYVSVLGINTSPSSINSMGQNINMNILGQTVETDGFVNDFQVEVSSTDINNNQIIMNPNFFNEITGYQTGQSNIGIYTFFETTTDAANLTMTVLIDSSIVNYQYATSALINGAKYDYPVGQIFYAFEEDTFYTTVQDTTVIYPSYSILEQTQYSMKPGRQGLAFKYNHYSNNTNRIDPVISNIIDLYLITASYHTSYITWLTDTTGLISKPTEPTMTELSQSYSNVQDYKMLTDSVILNSGSFKPLFGSKADSSLQGTIKVIKNSSTTASDSEIISAILSAMNAYFDISNWNFGDTFYFSELSAYLHSVVGQYVSSVVLVPKDTSKPFGTLYEIGSAPYEIFVNAATANDIMIISSLSTTQLG